MLRPLTTTLLGLAALGIGTGTGTGALAAPANTTLPALYVPPPSRGDSPRLPYVPGLGPLLPSLKGLGPYGPLPGSHHGGGCGATAFCLGPLKPAPVPMPAQIKLPVRGL
jgi:hypothetical protein